MDSWLCFKDPVIAVPNNFFQNCLDDGSPSLRPVIPMFRFIVNLFWDRIYNFISL